ncbi:unnamed protein product [Lampetra planeri]
MPPVEERAAIAPASGATWRETAILGAAASVRPDAAIFSDQRGMRLGEAASAGDGRVWWSNRLPNIKEFSTGGDWNAFTWRFESAFHSVKWTEDEALEALPTLLHDVSLAVFRSIPSGRKNTLRDAFAEMAEIYEPPSDAQRKFMHLRWGVNESSLAYRGALVALAMAAYPDSTADLLDHLIPTKMLELSKEMDISLPILEDQGCLELPEGQKMFFLPLKLGRPLPCLAVQAMMDVTVKVPPGAQMLIPLRYWKPLEDVDALAGILLFPSNSAANSFSLVAAQTVIRACQAPFIQVLNGGPDGVVVPAGVVLAHATTAFTD